jgi:hypothetical protein
MSTDLTILLEDHPGTLAAAFEALGRAGMNVDGATGTPCSGEGVLHLLVGDGGAARQALEASGQTVRGERDVLVCPVADKPGAAGAIFRRIADAGANVDLVYLTAGGQLVIGADDLATAERAAMSAM